jgi:glycosyltransferase involved in cell wall biosynthesis
LGEVSAWIFHRTTPTVITHHSDVVRQKRWLVLYKPLLRCILRRADSVIVSSPRYVETSPWLRPVRDKCVVIPLGVDDEKFSPPAETFRGPKTVLFVGKLRYYKGLDTLLAAMVSLPDVLLCIVGDGPQRKGLERMTADLRLTERVRFMGKVDDLTLLQYYRKAHVFALPSNTRAEAFGTVLLEAMASGLPCVTTELGTGTSWVVQDRIQGLIVPPGDPGALAEAIRSLMNDEALRREMGRAARERVMTLFRQSLMVHRVEELYRSLLDFSRKSHMMNQTLFR